jgi:MYXO-CTERM domain-containing protein
MKTTMTTSLVAAALCAGALAGGAHAALTLTQDTMPAGSGSLFNAVGTFNYGNIKSRLEASGQTTVQGGNPGNGWWGSNTGTGGALRSWEVLWNNTTGTVTFNIYANSDFTGLAMTMSQTPVLAAGSTLIGLDIGARLTSSGMGVTLGNVEFDGGSGFASIPTANASYSGNAYFSNYHALSGPLGSFTLRGTAQFTSGTTTGDSMRWFVNGRQGEAVPAPGAAALLGMAGLAASRRRRR